MKKSLISIASLAALALSPIIVVAHQAGDILVRGGLTNVSPDPNSTNILVGGADFALGGTTVGPVDVDSNTQLGLTVAYFYSDNVSIELLAATPFSHDINLTGAFAGTNLGSTKHLPPTLSVNYHFMDSSASFRPYVGAGLNYTVFFDEELNSGTVGVIEDAAGATVSDLSLDASFGIGFQVGADYKLNENWYINASARWIEIETEASFDVNGSDLGSVEKVEINPFVYSLSVGYKF